MKLVRETVYCDRRGKEQSSIILPGELMTWLLSIKPCIMRGRCRQAFRVLLTT